MPSNSAAYMTGKQVHPLEVRDAPYTSPSSTEVVIKNAAVAINPLDWMKQDDTGFIYGWIKYPFVLGVDVAGEVVEVGDKVTRFKVGDRVLGSAIGMSERVNDSSRSAFQLYTILQSHMTTPIPSDMSYESAAVIPLALSTASCALFQDDHLGLPLPTIPAKPTGKTVLIWGGSTSVGCNAIQLAVSAGCEVITTSSPRNFDMVKKLGASQVFDYNSKTVVADIINAFKDKTIAGAISIGPGAAEACMEVLDNSKGNKVIAMISYPMLNPPPKSLVVLRTGLNFASWMAVNTLKSKVKGIRTKFVFGDTLVDNGVGKGVFEDYLPQALAEGVFIPAPDPMVVGHGLDKIQDAFDVQKKGVSAKKVVVTL
jgi:NADPH:quinone reductase-like Zn-dependent oxidoreductase